MTRSAVWGEAHTRRQTAVSVDEPAGSTDKTIAFGTGAGAESVEANEGLVLRGRYRLEELLVRRPQAETWRAMDVLLVRPVVVHLLPAVRPNRALLAAAKKAAVATDFRVLRVLDATMPGQSDALPGGWAGPFIVCEYAPGQVLTDLLSEGPLSTLEAAWVVREIADALIGMHAGGLYHQRLSPDTVVITDSGNVKIVGFLLEAEMSPSHQKIRDPQQADVEALGRLLQAMLGAQVSVPPSLKQICNRILTPEEGASRLRTAAEVSAALSRVLGTADAAQDLEHRVQLAGGASADETVVHRMGQAYAETATLQTAALDTAVLDTPPVETPSVPRLPRAPKARRTPKPVKTPKAKPTRTTSRATRQPKRPTRWRRVLVPLAVLAILGGVIAGGLRLDLSLVAPGGAEGPGQVQAAGPSQQWPVVASKDFDPEGNGEEHPKEVTLAWDGDPGTSWTTMNYFEGDIGNKTGVGLVFDLGEVRQVSRVELDLDGNGTSLEVRIPAAERATSAPLSSVDQWRSIGTANRTPAATSIPLGEPVQTRYVLIYLTELPAAGGQFTGGIAEARFWS